ncbi:MAG: rubredoxin [Blautia sp.]|nr:rubredoxin [Blautia sp.]
MKYVCPICGYVHDEAEKGSWESLPDSWRCPLCGAPKADFRPEGGEKSAIGEMEESGDDVVDLSLADLSVICSNLAKGCEKQFQPALAQAFKKLADWFWEKAPAPAASSFEGLSEKVKKDLDTLFPLAVSKAKEEGDRASLRALTWSEKVTLMDKSLLSQYASLGEAMLSGQKVFVCTICGFVYVGKTKPEACPVCKVPGEKIEMIGGER